MRLLLIAASLLCVVALLRPPSSAATATGCPNFNGTWASNMGQLHLNGGNGTITQNNGTPGAAGDYTVATITYGVSASALDGVLQYRPNAMSANPAPVKIHLELGGGPNFGLAAPAGSTRFHGTTLGQYAGAVASNIYGYCTSSGSSVASKKQPVKIQITFFANSMLTFAPKISLQTAFGATKLTCPGKVNAHVSGHIEAQITPAGDTQGGGSVAETPFLHTCRTPTIEFAVERIAFQVLKPGHILRATMYVHISQEGEHQPGQCMVGTKGTITATYDDTLTVGNSLRNDQLKIGPWATPCNAHNHLITNSISSITAYASGSTYTVVGISCVAEGTGYSPRNCGV